MRIDGKLIAESIKEDLKERIEKLKEKGITPHLAVVLVGNDPSSVSYVNQKKKVGEEIGAVVSLYRLSQKVELLELVNLLNKDLSVHGIILQRPNPLHIPKEELDLLVVPKKDVDGFHPVSPFTPPIALAVLKILTSIFTIDKIKTKKILIIGRGETGGKPIADTLKKMRIQFQVAHSKTEHIENLTKNADIIISCVGRPHILRHSILNKKTILIGVGMHPEEDKLKGDYDVDEVKDLVSAYTPIPGGVGPVNVACLFSNLLDATRLQTEEVLVRN